MDFILNHWAELALAILAALAATVASALAAALAATDQSTLSAIKRTDAAAAVATAQPASAVAAAIAAAALTSTAAATAVAAAARKPGLCLLQHDLLHAQELSGRAAGRQLPDARLFAAVATAAAAQPAVYVCP